MNKYYQKALETKHDRRPVFEKVLSRYGKENPLNCLVVGSERDLDKNAIYGDGFFSVYAADKILNDGVGSITIVDIDPQAIENCKIILSDFIGKIDIKFVVGDGLEWTSKPFSLYYLDGGDQEWQTFEMFKKIDLRHGNVLLDDFNRGGKCDRIKWAYPFYEEYPVNHIHSLGFYTKFDNFGNDFFTVGKLELPYYRGWKGNREATNNRAVEIALVRWFQQKYANNIIEIGDVSCHYEVFDGHKVLDPFGPYEKSIREDVLDYNYTGLNVVSVSTWEHFSEKAYNNTDKDKPITALYKIAGEATNYLISFDVGADRHFEDWLMNQTEFKYTFLVRENFRGLINNWRQSNDKNNFYLPYLHWEHGLDYYGNAAAVCIITNQGEFLT